jgi:LPXTG-motif cell wall-anchored protein
MKKTLSALAIAGSLTFFGAGAAQAVITDDTYNAPEVTVGVSDATVAPGEAFIFSGSGFLANSDIAITASNEQAGAAGIGGGAGLGGSLGAGITGVIVPAAVVTTETTADAEGNFAVELTLQEEGVYTLTAAGTGADGEPLTVEQTVTVGDGVSDDENGSVAGGTGTDDNSAANQEAVANGDRLADTGLESGALLWGAAGVLALGAGATAVVVARRKNA